MKTQKERLLEYAASKNFSQNKLERELGLSNGAMTKQVDDLSDNIIGKIVKALPDLNTQWLLTGEGEMINGAETPIKQTTDTPAPPINKEELLITSLLDQIDVQKKYISSLEEKVSTLKKEKTFADAGIAHTA